MTKDTIAKIISVIDPENKHNFAAGWHWKAAELILQELAKEKQEAPAGLVLADGVFGEMMEDLTWEWPVKSNPHYKNRTGKLIFIPSEDTK